MATQDDLVTINVYDPCGEHRGDRDFVGPRANALRAREILEPIGWLIVIDEIGEPRGQEGRCNRA